MPIDRKRSGTLHSWQLIARQAAETDLASLLAAARSCRFCVPEKIPEAYPVLELDPATKPRIIIASQAPGRIAHETKLTFNDPSGDRLRDWMGIDRTTFYDTSKIAIIPMGLCYPGKAASGDKPPIAECKQIWHKHFFDFLSATPLILAVGAHSQLWHLGKRREKNLTETVRNFKDYLAQKEAPSIFPIPHPSPLNNIWLKRNPWFEELALPALKQNIRLALAE